MTETDCRQKKKAYDAAQVDLVAAKQNALEFGPGIPGTLNWLWI